MAGSRSGCESGVAGRAGCGEVDGSTTYLEYQPVIERVIHMISGRFRLSEADAPDFAQDARLWLIQEDIIARFENRSSLVTFLYSAMYRFGVNWYQARHGRWRSSALARRLGPEAIAAERLLARDRLTEREVVEVLRNICSTRPSELVDLVGIMAAHLMKRPSAQVPAHGSEWTEPDAAIRAREADAATDRVRYALAETFAQLSPKERQLLSMRFNDDQDIAALALLIGVDQRRMYVEFARLLKKVRASIVARGVVRDDVLAVLGRLDQPLF